MKTESINAELVKYNLTDTAIQNMSEQYMALRIDGIEDKKGYKAVHEARMIVKGKRVQVEKTRKELKSDAMKFCKTVDAEAKRITEKLSPIEEHLSSEERRIDEEKAEIKRQEEQKAREEQERKERELRERLEQKRREEEERLAAERAKLEEERAKMDAERREMERQREQQRLKMKALADEIEAERRAFEEEKRRKEEEEKARVEAEEQARLQAEREERERKEAEERAKREAELEAKRKAEEEALRLAMAPDKERLRIYIDEFERTISPWVLSILNIGFSTHETEQALDDFLSEADNAIQKIRRFIDG